MAAQKLEYVMVRYEKLRHISVGIHEIRKGALHEHGALEIGIVLTGKLYVGGPLLYQVLLPGSMYLFNPYEPHVLYSQDSEVTQVLSVWISSHFEREYFSRLSNTVFEQHLPREAQLRELLLQTAEQYFQESEAFQLQCVGTASLLLATMFRLLPHRLCTEAENVIKRKKQGRMQRIAAYMEAHYREKLTLSELAKVEGLTPAYMSRVFRELFHMSFQEYLNLLRLERALPLMRDPTVYLMDVCMECGFSDSRYLNSVCRKIFGCSATQYRRQYAQRPAAPLVEKLQRCETERYDDKSSLRLLEEFQLHRDSTARAGH